MAAFSSIAAIGGGLLSGVGSVLSSSSRNRSEREAAEAQIRAQREAEERRIQIDANAAALAADADLASELVADVSLGRSGSEDSDATEVSQNVVEGDGTSGGTSGGTSHGGSAVPSYVGYGPTDINPEDYNPGGLVVDPDNPLDSTRPNPNNVQDLLLEIQDLLPPGLFDTDGDGPGPGRDQILPPTVPDDTEIILPTGEVLGPDGPTGEIRAPGTVPGGAILPGGTRIVNPTRPEELIDPREIFDPSEINNPSVIRTSTYNPETFNVNTQYETGQALPNAVQEAVDSGRELYQWEQRIVDRTNGETVPDIHSPAGGNAARLDNIQERLDSGANLSAWEQSIADTVLGTPEEDRLRNVGVLPLPTTDREDVTPWQRNTVTDIERRRAEGERIYPWEERLVARVNGATSSPAPAQEQPSTDREDVTPWQRNTVTDIERRRAEGERIYPWEERLVARVNGATSSPAPAQEQPSTGTGVPENAASNANGYLRTPDGRYINRHTGLPI